MKWSRSENNDMTYAQRTMCKRGRATSRLEISAATGGQDKNEEHIVDEIKTAASSTVCTYKKAATRKIVK